MSEQLPEPESEPDEVIKRLGEAVLREWEHDPFIDGLSLGVWDEEFDYYKPKENT